MNMISRLECVEEVQPLYQDYLEYMRGFFEIDSYDSWYERAMAYLQLYAIEDDRFIYSLKESENIIGFALVNKCLRFNRDGFAIAEFYIRRDCQGQGYGRQLAEFVFDQYSGEWEVAVTLNNTSARIFWKKVVNSYTNGLYDELQRAVYRGYGYVFSTT